MNKNEVIIDGKVYQLIDEGDGDKMTKQNNEVVKNEQVTDNSMSPMSLIKQTLQMQGEHGKAIVETISYMESMNAETSQRFEEIESVQKELEKKITLSRGEQSRVKSAVMSTSISITNDFFKNRVSEALWNAKRGHTLRLVYMMLKDMFEVSSYTEISHVDYEKAMYFINNLSVEDFPRSYYRLTPKMKDTAEKYNDVVRHIQFGESSGQIDMF